MKPQVTAPPHLDPRHALFLDFDGTLAPIQDDPDTVTLPAGTADAIRALQPILGEAIVVISGRDIRDLSARVPAIYWRAGGHGLEICGPGEQPATAPASAPPAIRKAVEMITHGLDGIRVEYKGPVIAVHYRQAPELGEMLHARLADTMSEHADYKVQSGKMVLEAKPSHANKGRALERMMGHAPFAGRVPVMIGDDTTDEDAFAAASRLGGFAIKVGSGQTLAEYRVSGPGALLDWLLEQGRA